MARSSTRLGFPGLVGREVRMDTEICEHECRAALQVCLEHGSFANCDERFSRCLEIARSLEGCRLKQNEEVKDNGGER